MLFSLLFLVSFVSADVIIDEFKTWFENNGGFVSSIDIKNFDAMGNGLFALETIEAEHNIITVPSEIVFSKKSLMKSENENIQMILESFRAEQAIETTLLLELQNKSSNFIPYFNILPKYIPSLLYFTEKELRELQDKDLMDSALKMQSESFSNFGAMLKAIKPYWPYKLDTITYEQYKWIQTIVNSRGLRFRGEIYLAPMADMFNYQPNIKFRKSNSGEYFLKHHKLAEDGSITILSDRKQQRNEQVYEDYGDNTDDVYFQYHGFVPADNPFRCVKLQILTYNKKYNKPLLPAQKELLSQMDFKAPPQQCIDSTFQISKAISVYVTILSFTAKEVDHCMNMIRSNTQDKQKNWPVIMKECKFDDVHSYLLKNKHNKILHKKPIEKRNLNDRSLDLLQQIILSLLKEANYVTSISQDQNMLIELQTINSTEYSIRTERERLHYELAIKYRLYKKEHWKKLCRHFAIGDQCYDYLEKDKELLFTPDNVQQLLNTIMNSDVDNNGDDKDKHKTTVAAVNDNSKGLNTVDNSKNKDKAATTTDNDNNNNNDAKKTLQQAESQLVEDLKAFNDWFESYYPKPSKLVAVPHPMYRIGTIVKEDVYLDEYYLGVPDAIIMDTDKAILENSGVRTLIVQLMQKYNNRRDDYHELLFYLLYEKFIMKEQSKFYPYLKLLPTLNQLDIPLTWSEDQIESRLYPSVIKHHIYNYQDSIQHKFSSIYNIETIRSFFPDNVLNYPNYEWATAILDSRSIWWNGKRHLVPMLDFINCEENVKYPKRIHSTVYDEKTKLAMTKSGGDFKAGTQLFENYGQANHIYFTYHGFTLNQNLYDCVQVTLSMTYEESARIDMNKAKNIFNKLQLNEKNVPYTRDFCMTAEITQSVWVFLALKMNNYESLNEQEMLGAATPAANQMLLDIINNQIAGYDNYNSYHEASKRFIQSELVILKKIQEQLQANNIEFIRNKKAEDEAEYEEEEEEEEEEAFRRNHRKSRNIVNNNNNNQAYDNEEL